MSNAANLTSASHKFAAIFEIPVTGTVVGAEWRTGTVTTGSTMDLTLETVDAATGMPTGTLYDAAAVGTCIVASSDDHVWINDGFGGGTAWGSVTVTKNNRVALVVGQPSSSAGSLLVAGRSRVTSSQFPYSATNTSGSWVKNANAMSLALEYSGGVYYPIASGVFLPVNACSAYSWDNNDAKTEIGAKITVSAPIRAVGVVVGAELDKGVDTVIALYDSGGSEIATTPTIDTNILFNFGGGAGDAATFVDFTSPVEIAAGSTVYVGLKPQASTATIDLAYYGVNAAAHLAAMPGGGKIIKVDRATQGSGSWNEVTTEEPFIALICDQMSDGAGGGGGGVSRARAGSGLGS